MNALDEFLEHTEIRTIRCVDLRNDHYTLVEPIFYQLPCNYTPEQYHNFLQSLNFEYNEGYGSQYLFGTIWYTDGTWSTRSEYDGSEWWEHHSLPEIPLELQ